MSNQKKTFLASTIAIYIVLLLTLGAVIGYIYQTDLYTVYFTMKDIELPTNNEDLSTPSMGALRVIVWLIAILSFPLIILTGFEMIDKSKEV